MKSILRHLAIIALCCTTQTQSSCAVEPGFISLLDREHTDGWKQCGKGGTNIQNGVGTTWFPNEKGSYGVAWFTKRTFGDFVLKVEFTRNAPVFNSGIRLRFPDPKEDPKSITDQGYEVAIESGSPKGDAPFPSGSIYGFQRASAFPQRDSSWNEFEITAIGQKFTVKLNGVLVNEFTGSRLLSGYIGLENHRVGPVQFRNVRIKDLSTVAPAFAAPQGGVAVDPNQPLLETLSQQAPNASAWVLAPLDAGVPPDIRQNVTYLREDLLDEAAKKPKASPEAYKTGEQLCNTMIAALDERDRTLVRTGFRAVEAQARTGVTSDALEARRNYKMSWPQFARENAQRAELKGQANANAAVMAARPKLEWSNRTDQIRPTLDMLYKQFREALRQSPAAK